MSEDFSGRAPKGGIVAINGEHYQGGQFLPSHEDIEKGRYKFGGPRFDTRTPEQIAAAALQEAELVERRARNAEIALEPQNVFLIEWLASKGHYCDYVWGSSCWIEPMYLQDKEKRLYWYNDANLLAGIEAGEVQRRLEWHSGFFRDIYNNLALYGTRPADLSDRQYDALADIWIKEQGARKGSKRYDALWNEFNQKTMPEEV